MSSGARFTGVRGIGGEAGRGARTDASIRGSAIAVGSSATPSTASSRGSWFRIAAIAMISNPAPRARPRYRGGICRLLSGPRVEGLHELAALERVRAALLSRAGVACLCARPVADQALVCVVGVALQLLPLRADPEIVLGLELEARGAVPPGASIGVRAIQSSSAPRRRAQANTRTRPGPRPRLRSRLGGRIAARTCAHGSERCARFGSGSGDLRE